MTAFDAFLGGLGTGIGGGGGPNISSSGPQRQGDNIGGKGVGLWLTLNKQPWLIPMILAAVAITIGLLSRSPKSSRRTKRSRRKRSSKSSG